MMINPFDHLILTLLQGPVEENLRHEHPSILLSLQVCSASHETRIYYHQLFIGQSLHRSWRFARLHVNQGSHRGIHTSLVEPAAQKWYSRQLHLSRSQYVLHCFPNNIFSQVPCPNLISTVWTPLIPSTMHTKAMEEFHAVPIGRPGQPSEVATCFVFLASQDSSYIAGQCLHPNGGVMVNG